MDQEQRCRPVLEVEPIKYGDLFNIHGELSTKPVTPRDEAMMQSEENAMLGKTLRGGAAVVMQSAAMKNEKAGNVGYKDVAASAADLGVSVTEIDFEGKRIIVESFGEQAKQGARVGLGGCEGITIGEALEASAVTAGNKPVERCNPAAIQAAEMRAAGRTNIVPEVSPLPLIKDQADILTDATSKLPSNKVAPWKDAEGVTGAEMRNSPNLAIHCAGVSVSATAAVMLDQIHN